MFMLSVKSKMFIFDNTKYLFLVFVNYLILYEPRHEKFAYAKTKAQISFAVTAKLISTFVFATQIVQFFFSLNPEFQCSSLLL